MERPFTKLQAPKFSKLPNMLVGGEGWRVLDEAGSRSTRSTRSTRKPGQSAQGESTQGVFLRFHAPTRLPLRKRRRQHLSVPQKRDWRYYFMRCPPKRDRLQRQAFSVTPPLQGLSLVCDRPSLRKEVRGVAAIVCDAIDKTVRQRYCYTCLVIGGVFRTGH